MKLFPRLFKKSETPPLPDGVALDPDALKVAIGEALINDLIRERRSERNWRHIKRLLISGSAVILFAVYVGFYVTSLGYHVVPRSEIVGVVRITGQITEDSPTASADAVIPVLSKAFNKPNVKAIVLAIDSPGGRPGEVERIYNYIDAKKKETGKPVVAVIGNTGASAAYMLAVHTDKIYAGKYSLVGSIGAILTGWDFHKVAERFEVRQRVYASGSLKSMLDPWSPTTPEAETKAQDLVDGMGRVFADEVSRLRGDKLAKGVDFFTGEVWTGEQAKSLGLVDEVDTLDSMIKRTWEVGYHDFGPNKKGGGFRFPFGAIYDAVADGVVETIVDRLGLAGAVGN